MQFVIPVSDVLCNVCHMIRWFQGTSMPNMANPFFVDLTLCEVICHVESEKTISQAVATTSKTSNSINSHLMLLQDMNRPRPLYHSHKIPLL